MCEMCELTLYLSPSSTKGEEWYEAEWCARDGLDKEETTRKTIKDGPTPVMQEDYEDKEADYCSLEPEEWLDLITIIDIEDERKKAALLIINNKKNPSSAKKAEVEEDPDSDEILGRVTRKEKKSRTYG